MDEDYEYPTDEELNTIRTFDTTKRPIRELVEYIKSLWRNPDFGFKLYRGRDTLFKKSVMRLELYTGGWSGNESIMEALLNNLCVYYSFWEESRRGGHYRFEIPMDKWKQRRANI